MYLYHHAAALAKSHALVMAITRKELHKAGFENPSKSAAWEQFAHRSDALVVVTAVPLSDKRTYVHVVATSNDDASAKQSAADIIGRIKSSKMVLID